MICQAFEDILEGVELERGKASFCELEGLGIVSSCFSNGGMRYTSSWLNCTVVGRVP